jgi:hypothetical protein
MKMYLQVFLILELRFWGMVACTGMLVYIWDLYFVDVLVGT